MDVVTVALLAEDPVTRESAVALLSSHRRLRVVGADRCVAADVLLAIVNEVTEAVLAGMERASRRGDRVAVAGTVLVTNHIGEQQLPRAIDAGLVSLRPRRATRSAGIVDAVMDAATGPVPSRATLLSILVGQARSIGSDPCIWHENSRCEFTVRELDVLRLLSAGWETREIAVKLNRSESTVKNIIHGVLERHALRSRIQAVAHALRSGVL
jgi:DNA-binding NarL/FixJ family response regulator